MIVLIGLIGLIFLVIIRFLIKDYSKRGKKYSIIISLLLVICFIYTFCTYDGSTRFSMMMSSGDIYGSYTTGIKKGLNEDKGGSKFFTPTKNLQVESGGMLDTKCKSYAIIKSCEYYGF